MVIFLQALVTLAFVIGEIQATKCPPNSVVNPCFCNVNNDLQIWIKCSEDDLNESYTVINRLAALDVNVTHFTLSSETALSVRRRLFGGLYLKSIVLNFPRMKKMPYFVLEDQRYYTRSLTIATSSMSQIPIPLISSFSVLQEFEVSRSKNIVVLESNLFQPVSGNNQIKILKFVENSIKIIKKNAFSNVIHVKELHLRDNAITKIDPKIFHAPHYMKNLEKLVLWDNYLTEIPSEILENMAPKSTIDLYDNRIQNLSSKDIEVIIQKRISVDIGDNPLHCGCSFLTLAKAYDRGTVKHVTGECSKPSSLAGRRLESLSREDLQECP